MADVPSFFRMNIEIGDRAQAQSFYETLFATQGRLQAGSRFYLRSGAITFQIVAVPDPHPAAKALYFTVKDLDALHARAAALNCLSQESVHGQISGQIAVRPWGERSFYAQDPWNNPLCFVEEGTTYAG
jgi:predicted enzyme related to lactoylglutathione lyase